MESHLVTGATGLVGMHIVLDLLNQNKKVCATFTKNSNRSIIKHVFNHYGFSNYYDKELNSKYGYGEYWFPSCDNGRRIHKEIKFESR